jgi:penicillin-binding protein 1A
VDVVCSKEQIDEQKAEDYIFDNGLDIYTYYDEDIANILNETGNEYKEKIRDNIAITLTDVNGRIIACYNNDEKKENINYVLAGTYAGSTMKPVSVYAPAIDDGVIDWSTMVMDEPYGKMVNQDGIEIDWPSNVLPYTYEEHTIAEAIQKSMNTIAVKTLKMYGVKKSCDFLSEKLGMDISREYTLMEENGEDEILGNIALGYLRDGVNTVDMAGFYQIFANDGLYKKPSSISSLRLENKVYYERSDTPGERVISPETAYICNRMLKLVTYEDGTGYGAGVDGLDICGKTGTSDDYEDNWFVGFSPEYICAIWYDGSSLILHEDRYAVNCFHDIFEKLPTDGKSAYKKPENIDDVEIND